MSSINPDNNNNNIGINLVADNNLNDMFGYLEPQDVLSCACVCRRWNKLSSNERLWKIFFLNEFNALPQTSGSAKNQYLDKMRQIFRLSSGRFLVEQIIFQDVFSSQFKDKNPISHLYCNGKSNRSGNPSNKITVYDFNTNTSFEFRLPKNEEIETICNIKKAGQHVMTADGSGKLKIWDLSTNLLAHTRDGVLYSHREDIWLIHSNVASRLDPKSGDRIDSLITNTPIRNFQIVLDKYYFVFSSRSDLQIWQHGEKDQLLHSLQLPNNKYYITNAGTLVFFNSNCDKLCSWNFLDSLTPFSSIQEFPSIECNSAKTMIFLGPGNTIFCHHAEGWDLIDASSMKTLKSLRKNDFLDEKFNVDSIHVLDDTHILVQMECVYLVVWDLNNNILISKSKIPMTAHYSGLLTKSVDGRLFLLSSSGLHYININCSKQQFLTNLGLQFRIKETYIDVARKLSNLPPEVISKLPSSALDINKMSYLVLAPLRYSSSLIPEHKEELQKLANRLAGIDIQPNLNRKFLALPKKWRIAIIEEFELLISKNETSLTGLDLFLSDAYCENWRSEAITRFAATLPDESVPPTQFFPQQKSQTLYYEYDLEQIEKAVNMGKPVSTQQYLALLNISTTNDFISEMGLDPMLLDNYGLASYEDLKKIGLNLSFLNQCAKIKEELIKSQSTNVTDDIQLVASLKQFNLEAVSHLSKLEVCSSKTSHFNHKRNLKNIIKIIENSYDYQKNSEPNTKTTLKDSLLHAIEKLITSEKRAQVSIFQAQLLASRSKRNIGILSQGGVINIEDYITILGIGRTDDLSYKTSTNLTVEKLQNAGVQNSDDLKLLGLDFHLFKACDDLLMVIDDSNSSKSSKKEQHENYMEITSFHGLLNEVLKHAKTSFTFSSSLEIEFPSGISLTKRSVTLNNLEKLYKDINIAKSSPKSLEKFIKNLESWKQDCHKHLMSLRDEELQVQLHLLSAFGCQSDIENNWDEIVTQVGQGQSLSTIDKDFLPSNLFQWKKEESVEIETNPLEDHQSNRTEEVSKEIEDSESYSHPNEPAFDEDTIATSDNEFDN